METLAIPDQHQSLARRSPRFFDVGEPSLRLGKKLLKYIYAVFQIPLSLFSKTTLIFTSIYYYFFKKIKSKPRSKKDKRFDGFIYIYILKILDLIIFFRSAKRGRKFSHFHLLYLFFYYHPFLKKQT